MRLQDEDGQSLGGWAKGGKIPEEIMDGGRGKCCIRYVCDDAEFGDQGGYVKRDGLVQVILVVRKGKELS